MKASGEVGVQIHIFLTSVLVGGEWSASLAGRFTPGEVAPGILYWIGGWVGLLPWRTEKSCFYRDSNFDPSVVQPIAKTLYRLPYPSSLNF
jgi:hypothetical protein